MPIDIIDNRPKEWKALIVPARNRHKFPWVTKGEHKLISLMERGETPNRKTLHMHSLREQERLKMCAKIVSNEVLLKTLESTRIKRSTVAPEIIKELKAIKKQPNKWFVLDSTSSSTHVRRILTGMLKESVKTTKNPDGKWTVRRVGTKRKDGKVVDKGHVYVKYVP